MIYIFINIMIDSKVLIILESQLPPNKTIL